MLLQTIYISRSTSLLKFLLPLCLIKLLFKNLHCYPSTAHYLTYLLSGLTVPFAVASWYPKCTSCSLVWSLAMWLALDDGLLVDVMWKQHWNGFLHQGFPSWPAISTTQMWDVWSKTILTLKLKVRILPNQNKSYPPSHPEKLEKV